MLPSWLSTGFVLLALFNFQVLAQYSGWYGQQQMPCYGNPIIVRQESDDDGLKSILPILLLLLTDGNGRFGGGSQCGCCRGGCNTGCGCGNCGSGCNCGCSGGGGNGGGMIPIPYPIPIPINCPIIT